VRIGVNADQKDPLQLIIANNPHPMWIFDHTNLQFQEVNPAAVAKYGYSRSEFLRKKITEIRPKDQIPLLLAGIRPFKLNGTRFAQMQHLTKDGRLIDVEITACQFFFKGRPSVLVQARDITDQKKAEETVRRLAIVEERNRIAREIHDTLAQGFTGILLQLEAASDVLPPKSKAKEHITNARNLARHSLMEARRSVYQLRPQELQRGTLTSAIKRLANQAKRDGVPVHCSITGETRIIPEETENNLLRIAQEALINVIRHARATKVELLLSFNSGGVKLTLKDNGIGFNPERNGKGFGLVSIRERANTIGAKLMIHSKRGRGSILSVTVPYE
jgi:PAS domain S-box-containing protein